MGNTVGLAIVTYTINYGTFLQAFATQTAVNNLGYETEIINIDSVISDVSKARKKYFAGQLLNFSEVKSYFPTVQAIIQEKINPRYREYYSARAALFKDFHDRYFKFGPICDSWKGLSERCDEYSSVIVGSDQLWRPANIAGNFYTLNFVPEEVNKISYATSFGLNNIRESQKRVSAEFLQRIQHLSCREESGVRIIEKLIGRDAKLVCDPTLLLTKPDWEQFIQDEPIVNGEYILTYLLSEQKQPREFVKELSKRTNCKVVGILHGAGYIKGDEKNVDEYPAHIDPFDFINLIKNAKYVCTDSFHGCVFSIIFEKNFFAFKRFSDKDAMSTNNRVTNLLSKFSITDRLVTDMTSVDSASIDYTAVNKCVDAFRAESQQFLESALNEGR